MINKNAIVHSLSKNYLGLFDSNGNVELDKTSEFMELSLKELAEAFGLTPEQLRPGRLGSATKEKLTELAGALETVAVAFDGDKTKTKFWLNTPNYNFGGITPKKLILRGRYKKVMQFIYSSKTA